ncbi:MAG: alpha-amylase family glycosyl hydrolase, partial [Woeseiaceae bacterium]|nr:alpha-amylase family glycosyl hydrolase [Woeseiaceae bacterium]
MRNLFQNLSIVAVAAWLAACGGGGGSGRPPQGPGPQPEIATLRYLRVEPAYSGWGLHLWGDAIAPGVATSWQAPRPYDRVENGAAVFEIPVVSRTGALNFIAHNGDLKSPVEDLTIRPGSFGFEAWIVQDTVAAVAGGFGIPFDNEVDARAALAALGDASAALDLGAVPVNDVDSGLPAAWAGSASFMEIYVRGYQDSDGDGIGDFAGLVSRLDYLADLGITAIWLMPVTESADNDHGYAVEDY